ncbi:hypothetical protein MED121_06415 [Marinomonas sp. MED121]|nr:hypothetical protein MED121_06415 [Marinomonas sp. MED121]
MLFFMASLVNYIKSIQSEQAFETFI